MCNIYKRVLLSVNFDDNDLKKNLLVIEIFGNLLVIQSR